MWVSNDSPILNKRTARDGWTDRQTDGWAGGRAKAVLNTASAMVELQHNLRAAKYAER